MSAQVLTSFLPQRLKEATSEPHQELESLSISKSILKPDVTSEEYLKYLDLMHDIIYSVESTLFPLLYDYVTDLEDRKKAIWIEQDFSQLSYPKHTYINVLEGMENISVGFALGMLYVLEGSTLGGRIISKHILKTLGYDFHTGAAYFNGYGDQTGAYWKNFLAVLVAHEKTHNTSGEIIEGAVFAFQKIKNHFLANTSR